VTPRFPFEEELAASRVYKRTQFYPSDRDTFTSTVARTHAFSIFSGLSLADISVLSVIALPLLPSDISNGDHYKFTIPNSVDSPYPWSKRKFPFERDGYVGNKQIFPRYGAAVNQVAASNGQIYLIGGLINSKTLDSVVCTIFVGQRPSCSQIMTTKDIPDPRIGHRAVVVGNALCVFGGDSRINNQGLCDQSLYLLNRGRLSIVYSLYS
jgi:hypothetical protein